MSVIVRRTATAIATSDDIEVQEFFLSTDVLDPVYLGEYGVDETPTWPAASPRPTTERSARAFEAATTSDPNPQTDELAIDDGLGI